MTSNCFVFILALLIGSQSIVSAQQKNLKTADSLYQQRNYTEAISIYDSILEQGYTSPQMLLKMAYIEEGLNNVTQAIYYLSLYHKLTRNDEVLSKMEELASDHNLSGYNYDDQSYLLNFFFAYRHVILWSLAGLILLLFLIAGFLRIRERSFSAPLNLSIAIIAIFLLIFNIRFLFPNEGVLTTRSFVMTAPSAASDVSYILNEGYKVKVTKQKGVWYKIELSDTTGYIRNTDVKLLKEI